MLVAMWSEDEREVVMAAQRRVEGERTVDRWWWWWWQ